jgi:hypothetical protein
MLELLEEAALQDYPNPQRIGCPGTEFLKRLATNRRSIKLSDPALDHVARCSPCFSEFVQYRDRRKHSSISRRTAIAAGGTIIVAGAAATFRLMSNRSKPANPNSDAYEDAEFDMLADSPTRGVTTASPSTSNSQSLRRKRLNLHITLPFGSSEGNYEVQVMGPDDKPTGLKASGRAHIVNGKTLLTVRLDLRKLHAAAYKLGIRRIPYDWTSQPVQIN